jgi:hypothetical protein
MYQNIDYKQIMQTAAKGKKLNPAEVKKRAEKLIAPSRKGLDKTLANIFNCTVVTINKAWQGIANKKLYEIHCLLNSIEEKHVNKTKKSA